MAKLSRRRAALGLVTVFIAFFILAMEYSDEFTAWLPPFKVRTLDQSNRRDRSLSPSELTAPRLAAMTLKGTSSTRGVNGTKKETKKLTVSTVSRQNIVTTTRPPVVTLLQDPLGEMNYGPGQGEHCGCEFTRNRSRVAESDAVVLYCRDSDKSNLPPDFPNRALSQIYVWWCREPPTHLKIWDIYLGYRRGFFNWTMTFRRDSDIKVTWGFAEDAKSKFRKKSTSVERLVKEKNKTAIAVVGNCGYHSYGAAKSRLKLLNEMAEKGLDVETYGKCFKREIEQKKLSSWMKYYKFYMSFENSYHCKDYITEKFWTKAIYAGLVPVVWGARREDYEAVAPESSFIFVEDFESIDKLVEYLQFLDRNDTAYSRYFKWRSLDNLKDVPRLENDPFIGSTFSDGCELCRHLLRRRDTKDTSVSSVDSIENYSFGQNDKDCLRVPGGNETYWRYAT